MKQLTHAALVAISVAGALGCGGDTTPKLTQKQAEERVFGGTTADDQTKIKEYLKKGNIAGRLISIEDKGEFWVADVGSEAVPGKRSAPMPPQPYKVDKKTGAITKM